MRVRIACPNGTVTGGIELLHQTANELNKNGVDAKLWYIAGPTDTRIPSEYECYGCEIDNDIRDDDILLFPEIWASWANQWKQRSLIYWESVDNYFPHTSYDNWFRFPEDAIHISQTEYSNRFLRDVVKTDKVIEITDYINDEYLHCMRSGKRDPIVLYNPTKGFELTQKIIRYAPDIEFIPVTGMARAEIIELMRRSMVWIDFGNFPGKDRLPREAASCGLCLITGKHGTAKYHKDLAIPEEYKVADVNYADIGPITEKIRDILNNFDEHTKKFDSYRKHVKQEKKQFEKGIKTLVAML